jgi:hypothetical protein
VGVGWGRHLVGMHWRSLAIPAHAAGLTQRRSCAPPLVALQDACAALQYLRALRKVMLGYLAAAASNNGANILLRATGCIIQRVAVRR